MPRFIPISLKDHLRQDATTTCYLLRVDPVSPGFTSYGVTTLDRDVTYDDGSGEMMYSAAVGSQPTTLQGRADLSVDNAESVSLMPEFDIPVQESDIRAGAYDFSRYSLYLVNYQDLSQGHILVRSGTLGRITVDDDGLSFVNELRGLSAELKQSVCTKDSLSCRARFGSQPIGSSTPGPQVRRDWCGYPAETLLRDATVLSVGLENTLTFSVAAESGVGDGDLNPGMVFWITGSNAGLSNEIDTNTGGTITLAHEARYPIQVGDDLQYREDCSKRARDSEKGCLHWFEEEWVLHFRGEPDIPIGDAGAMETPGASSPPGGGGYTSQPFQEAE